MGRRAGENNRSGIIVTVGGGQKRAFLSFTMAIGGSLGVLNFVVTSLGMKLSCKEKRVLLWVWV